MEPKQSKDPKRAIAIARLLSESLALESMALQPPV